MTRTPGTPIRGRGSQNRLPGRFARTRTEADETVELPGTHGLPDLPDDEVGGPADETELIPERIRSLITRNQSPDISFDRSINPYRGCEHGCIYCYARPYHAYVDLSPGLDFEQKIFVKNDAATVLRRELSRPGYRCAPIALGVNTDAWQPAERQLGITRSLLEVLLEFRHPVSLISKSALIERDLDLLAQLAALNLVSVMISVTTLDDGLKRRMEPRTASGRRRIAVIRRLNEAGVPCGVMAAPLIPAVNDHELEDILAAAAEAGARRAGYTLVRLPHEVAPLFREWLESHYPMRAGKVESLIRQTRGGRLNDPRFGSRQRGNGVYAALLARRFRVACERFGYDRGAWTGLDTSLFRVPPAPGQQLDLLG